MSEQEASDYVDKLENVTEQHVFRVMQLLHDDSARHAHRLTAFALSAKVSLRG
jgi:hypothetical protein